MRFVVAVLALLPACAGIGLAQSKRAQISINLSTPQGQLLQKISDEKDPAKKIALGEQFVSNDPQHEAVYWVLGQLNGAYTQADQFSKAIETGRKVLAADPDDLEISYGNLKAAEGMKQAAPVIEWSNETSRIARRIVAAPKPADISAEDQARRIDYARQVDIYTEYSLYATGLQVGDPAQVIALGKELEKRNASSQYLDLLYPPYFAALQKAGDTNEALALGERAAARNRANEDMLLMMANTYLQQKADPSKVIAASEKLIAVLSAKARPEGVAEADWNKKKTQMLGVANWMAGVSYGEQSKWVETDKAMRAALPEATTDAAMNSAALFYLGVANYNLGKAARSRAQMTEALKFSEKAAAIEGPYKTAAAGNVKAIRAEMLKLPK